MLVFTSADDLRNAIGKTIGPSDWLTITQDMIDNFADATGDHQWIHVDVERAIKEAPGGKTIAHGFFSLSLLGQLQPKIYTVSAPKTLNYGLEKLRFLNAIPVGSNIRLSEEIQSVEETSGGYRTISRVTIEIEGQERPALVADIIFLYFFDV